MNRLHFLRTEKGLTVRQLGDALNISYPTITNIENGKRGFSDDMLIQISNYFNVSTDYLLGKSNIRNPQEILDDEFEVAFHGEVKDLTPEAKEKILEYARLLKISQENKK